MKKTHRYMMRIAAMFCLVAAMAASALGGEIRHTLSLDPSQLVADTVCSPDGTPYLRLWAPDCDYVGEPGEPMIPYKCINFLVPTYSNNFSVRIDNVTTSESRTLELPLYPVQEPQSINDHDPDFFTPLANPIVMESDKPTAKVVNEYVVNGDQHIVTVAIPMISLHKSDVIVNNQEYMAIQYDSVVLNLNYDKCSAEEIPFVPLSSIQSELDRDISELVVNYEDYNTPAQFANTAVEDITQLTTGTYVILVPDILKESFNDFANWKRQKGYNVLVKTVEEITADPKYKVFENNDIREVAFDKESHIRNWLKYLYFTEKLGAFHLFIAGDYRTSAPIRKFRDITGNSKEWYDWYDGENFIPTDSYFTDLTSKFILDKKVDNYNYGNLSDQKTYSPLLSTGRLLAYEPDQVSTYTNKLLIYEIDPGLGDRNYLDKVLVSRQDQHKRYPSLLGHLKNFKDSILLTDETSVDNFVESRPVGKQVIDAMRQCGLVSMQGHGSPVTIACSGKSDYNHYRYIQAMSTYDVINDIRHENADPENAFDLLGNYGKPGIFYTLSCTVTPFDNIVFPGNGARNVPFDMGSGYTVAGDFGGVAFIGNTRIGIDSYNKKMELEFGRRIAENCSLGSAVTLSNSAIDLRYAQYTRNLIGDPDIKIWHGSPTESDVNGTCVNGNLTLTGRSLLNSRISVSNGSGYSKSFRANNTSVTINIRSCGFSTTDPLIVTVMQDGVLPYINIFTDNCTVQNSAKNIFARKLHLNSQSANGNSLNIMSEGFVNLRCTDSFSTNGGFSIGNGGGLNIRSLKNVCLQSDLVRPGASLNIEAKSLELKSGFTVEKGGEFIFTIK